MTSYTVFVASHSAELVAQTKSRDRNQILRLFKKLRANPFLEGDYVERDDVGRLRHCGAKRRRLLGRPRGQRSENH